MRDNRRLLAVGRHKDYLAIFFNFVERFVVDSHLVGILASLEMIRYALPVLVLVQSRGVFLVRLKVPEARTDMRQWKRALVNGIVLSPMVTSGSKDVLGPATSGPSGWGRFGTITQE